MLLKWLDTVWIAVLWNGRLACEIRFVHIVMGSCIPLIFAVLWWMKKK